MQQVNRAIGWNDCVVNVVVTWGHHNPIERTFNQFTRALDPAMCIFVFIHLSSECHVTGNDNSIHFGQIGSKSS